MNSYVIQHIVSGAYIAPIVGYHVVDPHHAHKYCSREAAQRLIDCELVAHLYRVAILPATRALLSIPTESRTYV